MLGPVLQGAVPGAASLGQAQPVGVTGENPGTDFLASLETSLQALAQGEQSPITPFDPAQLLAVLQQMPGGLSGGNGLPLQTVVAAAQSEIQSGELTPELRELMAQLQQGGSVALMPPGLRSIQARLLATPEGKAMGQPGTASATTPAIDPLNTLVMTPVAMNGEAQSLGEQRRLFERFQSLPEVRLAMGDMPATALRQPSAQTASLLPADAAADTQNPNWLGSMNADLALTPAPQGDDFALQLSRMTEMKNFTMTLKDGAALESLESIAKSDLPDVSSLAGAGSPRNVTPTLVSDARPSQSFIHVPLNDPQWQSEFNNRVTWLARAGGNSGSNQSAEIRLNPANMGPIEVRIAMNDDQATITFTAQHGVVRDAIEASLPRLREMFTGSGLQLAQANVSDQPLHDQRQRQQQGFGSGNGNGRSQGGYDQVNGIGDLVSPISLSMLHSSALADRLDLYA
jgi:hypothetical protein